MLHKGQLLVYLGCSNIISTYWWDIYFQKSSQVKEGVDFVFEQNPELANIGNEEQYSQYLDTIFPDYIDNFAYEAVEELLVVNKIIDRKC